MPPHNDQSLGIICTFCGATFGRQEHLTRHVRSHLNHRPFQCQACSRHFSRRDTLTRHITSNCSVDRSQIRKTARPRASTACQSCARSKLRCSMGVPCKRCLSKGITCVYPERAKERCSGTPLEQEADNNANSQALGHTVALQDVTSSAHSIDPPLPTLSTSVDTYNVGEAISAGCGSFGSNTIDDGLFHGTTDLDWLLPFELEDMGNDDVQDTVQPWESGLDHISINGKRTDYIARPSNFAQVHSTDGMVQPALWAACSRATSPSQRQVNTAFANKHPPIRHGRRSSPIDIHKPEPATQIDLIHMDNYGHVPKISDAKAAEIYEHVVRLLSPSKTPKEADLTFLERRSVINMFIQLYFEHFHLSLPLLHKVTFNPLEMPWILNLAVATLGSHYSRIPNSYKYTSVLGSCLRLAVSELIDHDINKSIGVPFAQAVLLSQVETAYSGRRNLVLKAQFYRGFSVTICRGIAAGLRRRELPCSQTEPSNRLSPQWLQRELQKRIVYCGWLLDCQYSLHYDVPFMMTLDDIDLELPYSEELWEKPNSVEEIEQILTKTATLKDIILTTTTRNLSDVGDFAKIIGIASIYHQSRLILQTSGHWFGGSDPSEALQTPFDHPIYIQWRHSAMDRLATLFQIPPRQSGTLLSDTTEKLYHTTSILIYIPLKTLCSSVGWMATETSTKSARTELSAWLSQDKGRNARVAVRHAAILFALMRTRSTNTYYEAQSLLLSTLTIWAFATLQPHEEYEDDDDEDRPSIYLDRPMSPDEEEDWVSGKSGQAVPRIAGVGCVLGPLGARRLLFEACDLLARHECWGINRRIMIVLERLNLCGNALSL